MKKVFTSILLLAALSVPAYLSASAWLEGDGDQQEQGGGDGGDATDFADGKYYFKNVGAGLYWGAGNSWGTQASLLKNPDYLTLVSNEDGTYKLESQVSNGGTAYYFNGSYMDNGSPVSLTITKLENGFYTIANGETFYGSDGSTILAALESGAEANAQWEIITEADMLASLANATKDAPVDATFLIADHTFGRNNRNVSAWTNEGSAALTGGNSNKHDAEKYHGVFNVYQKLANAPAGVYKFTAQGFYRQDGTDEENLPIFYANDVKVNIPVKTGSENSMADACTSFEAGLYAADPIYVQVTEAGELTVGAKLETNTTLWVIWDNFELTYYGTEATIDEVRFAGLIAQLAELKADATALKDNEYITAAAITEIETAIAATEAEMTTEDDYNTAIATMQDVIKAANQAIKDNKIVVTGIVPDNELDNWACTNSNTFHINTWSTEGNSDGSEMKTPFIENWVGKPGPLGEGDITYIVPGTFEKGLVAQVSALIRIYSESGAEPAGASFFVNNDTVSIAEIGESFEYNEMKGVYANIKVKGAIGEDGKLIFGVNIAEPTFNWVAIKSVNFKVADETTIAYENALAAIKDGEGYRVFTEVEGTKYYLNTTGFLTDDTQKAATFEFKKVEAAGTPYQFGWNLGCQFTNPSTGGNTSFTNDGHIHTGSQNRDNWERQVFFMNDEGLFAVRATNATDPAWGANTYWDAFTDAELPKAGYSLEPAYVWQIEGFVDKRPEAFAKTQTWAAKLQNIEGLVTAASQWSSNAKEPSEGSYEALTDNVYTSFFHSQWSGTAVGEDHYIQAELPEAQQDFYFYFKKRSQNNNNRPTDLVISGSNDGVEFAEIKEITEGLPTDASIIEYISAKISAPEAYKYIRFTVKATNNGEANNGHVFFTFSELYILPADELVEEAVKYMVGSYTDIEIEDIEAIETLDARIDNYFHDVTFELAFNGEIIASETIQQKTGQPVTAPASFKTAMHGLYALTPDVAVIADDTEKVVFTPTWAGPFEFSTDFENAKWYNMNIRNGWQVSKCETEPYTMKNDATDEELASPEFQWAFFPVADDPLKVVVVNKAAESQSLTPVDISRHAVVLREGEYAWDIFANADGFVLREVGTENGWVNQAGGGSATSPLAFWDNAAGKTDGGSTFRVSEVPFVILDNMPLTKDMFKNWIGFDATAEPTETTPYWDAAELGAEHSAGNTIYGSGNVANTDFADVTGAEALRIEGTVGIQLRVLINRQEDNSLIEINPVIGEDGYVDVDLTSYEYVHINAIKLGWSSPAGSVTALILNPTAAEPAGDTYAGIIEQTQYGPDGAEIGKTTTDQTVTITEVTEGIVNITFSGFTLPMAALGSFNEFTVENVVANTQMIPGYTVYVSDAFQVGVQMGQMAVNYNGELYGAVGPEQTAPVFKLILQNATKDVAYFGANQEDIEAFKAKEFEDSGLIVNVDVNRYPGMGYAVTEATVSFADALEELGVEAVSTDMLYFVNPNGTEISYEDYMTANYDGWCDAEGTATNWGANTAICVKFFQAIPNGKFEICDMNGADEIGKTYMVTWRLRNGDKFVDYVINVKFVEVPEINIETVGTIEVYGFDLAGTAYNADEKHLPTFDTEAVCEALGIQNLDNVETYIVNVTTGEFVRNTTDGWRNIDGDATAWGEATNGYCLKLSDPASGVFDYCGAHDANFAERETYLAKWAIVADNKAVVLNVNITFLSQDDYDRATGINSIAADVENGKVFNIAGQKTGRVQKGVNIIGGKKVYVK